MKGSQNPRGDLLPLLKAGDRALERLVELAKRFASVIDARLREAAPMARRFVDTMEQLQTAPPIKGYEPLFLADGCDPLEAKFLAAAALYAGKQAREEALSERRLAGAIVALAKAPEPGALAISRIAKRLKEALAEPSVEVSLWRAWFDAQIRESPGQLKKLVAGAMERDRAACRLLTEIARELRPRLRDPRGRIPRLESAAHEAFLALRNRGAYTYDDVSDDMTDASTQATRAAMNAPDFDPRPAHRRNKRRAMQERGLRVHLS